MFLAAVAREIAKETQINGTTFKPESGPHQLNFGNCFYASQTFNDAPDGRRVLIGWGTMSLPGMPFNQMMCFPCELTLRTTPEGIRLFFQPVKEIDAMIAKVEVAIERLQEYRTALITAAVVSATLIVCEAVEVLPQASVARAISV